MEPTKPNVSKFKSMDDFVKNAEDLNPTAKPKPTKAKTKPTQPKASAKKVEAAPAVIEKPAPFNIHMPPGLRTRIKVKSALTKVAMNDLIVEALLMAYPDK